jgi:hypothetical protein
MQLSICLLHKRNPEFLSISAVTIKRLFGSWVVRNTGVNLNILPFSIFEKFENAETELQTILHNQIAQDIRINSNRHERAEKPAIVKNALLAISRNSLVLHQDTLVFTVPDFFRPFPFYNRNIGRILWRPHRVNIQR